MFIPFLIPAVAQARSISAWWWTPTALICAALPGVLVGVHCLISANPVRLRRWAALGALGVLVAEFLWWPAWNGTPLDDATVYWLGPFVVLGTICAMIAWKPAPAALYLIVCAVTFKVTGNVAQGVSSPATMITDAACSAAFAIVPFALGVSGLSIAATLDRNSAAEIALAEQTAATRARLAQRALARAITHDEIMSTLLEASRDPESPELPSRATATLVALDDALRETTSGLNPEPAGVVGRLSEAAQRNDPGMTVSSDVRASAGSTYPQSAVDALVGATAEAARNCFRHVPPECTRFCRILVEDHGIEVTIGDDGPGFDRSAVPRERLGLAMSVEERLRRVGGEATVDSVPGRGTTLALGWRRPAEPVPVDDPDPLRLRSSTARVLASTIIVVLAVSAALNPGSVPWWAPVAIIAMMAVAVAFLVGGAADLLRPLPGLFVAAVPALMCATYLLTLADTTQTIPLWVTGPPALMAALLAMRGRPTAAILGFAVALAVSGLWSYRDGQRTSRDSADRPVRRLRRDRHRVRAGQSDAGARSDRQSTTHRGCCGQCRRDACGGPGTRSTTRTGDRARPATPAATLQRRIHRRRNPNRMRSHRGATTRSVAFQGIVHSGHQRRGRRCPTSGCHGQPARRPRTRPPRQ
ncbi:sensor histidine kinase [Gordonia sputi]|uniref:sensor histidine kinase n=1 Tax=Gordonia sputi TaxID=36823 RepID=UPI0011472AE4|nr:ATP-binding protein [Gordonia sputi]NKY92601.1 hypothetical protein [Gordonia sputi]